VLAHGEYVWIRDPEFRTEDGRHCCSDQHCRPAAAGELEFNGAVWRHVPTGTELAVGSRAIYNSRDPAGRTFMCIMGGHMVCLMRGVAS
jgi:hypothetical protein